MYLDQKVTVWKRISFNCNEDELKQLEKDVLKHLKEGKTTDEICGMYFDIIEHETIYDTGEEISVEENGGCSTMELYNDDGELIFENA